MQLPLAVVGNQWSYSEGMYMSEEQGALPILQRASSYLPLLALGLLKFVALS